MKVNPNKDLRYLGLAMMFVGACEIALGLALILR
jgi:NADH:ubiquinone oxidoreductase subunit K